MAGGAPQPQAGVRPGDILAGKYRVERILGAGGMGVVVAAHHIQLDERVALKFLLPEALANPEAVGRFVREARAAVKIKGEHVARVSDVGELENGAPYIVMEHLEGMDLSAWLKQRGPLPIELAVDFVLQTCEAIANAHVLGIIHRDLKPANLFCVRRTDGQLSIKVLDFGISKVTVAGAGGHELTRTNALVGSPLYMSPEQMQSSRGVDTRTDIWSLGIVLFELLTDRAPFAAEAVTELAIKIAVDPAPPVRTFRADVPPGLEQVIATCLEKDRARRYPSVGELAVALQGFGSRQAQASVERILGTLRQAGVSWDVAPPSGMDPPRTSQVPATAVIRNTSASWGRSSATSKPRAWALLSVSAVVLLLLVVGVGGMLMLRRSRATTAAAAVDSAPVVTAPSIAPVTPPPPATPPPPLATAEPAATVVTSATAASAAAPAPASAPASSPLVKPAGRPPRTVTGAAGASNPPVPTAKPNCDPPYYFDAQGARIFKKECL
ncbi:MAG: serine/threonine-protein kinase [Polyangiaceae bacterium]